MDGVTILQFILMIVILGVILYLLRLYRAVNLENRIGKFAISSVNHKQISFFDNIYLFLLCCKFMIIRI